MKKKLFIFILLAVFLAGCEGKIISQENLWLETRDNKKLSSTVWYSRGDKAVILIHMLDHDKEDYKYFAKKLNVFRFTAMSLDLRGHGKSDGNWKEFDKDEFNNMVYDVEAAKRKLEKEGKKVVGIVGASIGANVALKYAKTDPGIKRLILLSPGIEYKGINIEKDIEEYYNPILIAVSEDDVYPYQSSNTLYEKAAGEKELFTKKELGHGTDMFKSEELQNRIIEFLSEVLK